MKRFKQKRQTPSRRVPILPSPPIAQGFDFQMMFMKLFVATGLSWG